MGHLKSSLHILFLSAIVFGSSTTSLGGDFSDVENSDMRKSMIIVCSQQTYGKEFKRFTRLYDECALGRGEFSSETCVCEMPAEKAEDVSDTARLPTQNRSVFPMLPDGPPLSEEVKQAIQSVMVEFEDEAGLDPASPIDDSIEYAGTDDSAAAKPQVEIGTRTTPSSTRVISRTSHVLSRRDGSVSASSKQAPGPSAEAQEVADVIDGSIGDRDKIEKAAGDAYSQVQNTMADIIREQEEARQAGMEARTDHVQNIAENVKSGGSSAVDPAGDEDSSSTASSADADKLIFSPSQSPPPVVVDAGPKIHADRRDPLSSGTGEPSGLKPGTSTSPRIYAPGTLEKLAKDGLIERVEFEEKSGWEEPDPTEAPTSAPPQKTAAPPASAPPAVRIIPVSPATSTEPEPAATNSPDEVKVIRISGPPDVQQESEPMDDVAVAVFGEDRARGAKENDDPDNFPVDIRKPPVEVVDLGKEAAPIVPTPPAKQAGSSNEKTEPSKPDADNEPRIMILPESWDEYLEACTSWTICQEIVTCSLHQEGGHEFHAHNGCMDTVEASSYPELKQVIRKFNKEWQKENPKPKKDKK